MNIVSTFQTDIARLGYNQRTQTKLGQTNPQMESITVTIHTRFGQSKIGPMLNNADEMHI